jgi:hypothetical protein
MYIAQFNSDDCPSENDGRVIAKGKTMHILIQKLIDLTEDDLFDNEQLKYEYDDNYFYIDGDRRYNLQKI